MPHPPTPGLRHLRRIVLSGANEAAGAALARIMGQRWKTQPITHCRPTEAARRMGYLVASDVAGEDLAEAQWETLMAQLRAEGGRDYFVTNGGTLDLAAFWLWRLPEAQPDDPFVRVAMRHARTYDAIIVVPPASRPAPGTRHLPGRWQVHGRLLQLLKDHQLDERAIVLASDGADAHYDEVMRRLFGAEGARP